MIKDLKEIKDRMEKVEKEIKSILNDLIEYDKSLDEKEN